MTVNYSSLDYLPEILDSLDEEMLVDEPNKRYITGMRHHVMFKFVLTTGIRADELHRIKWDSIDLIGGTLNIKSNKRQKSRRVAVPYDTIEALEAWSHRQRLEIAPSPFMFTTTRNNPVCKRNFRRIVSDFANKAGISFNVSPHTLRHTYGTKLYKNSQDLEEVKEALGITSNYYAKQYKLLADEDVNPLF